MTGASTHLWTIPLRLGPRDQAALFRTLSDDEKAQAARLVFDEHRRRFINRRGALRSILAEYLELRPDEIEFRTGRFGQPWLPQAGEKLSFSASHSREVAIVVVGAERRLGADIEWVHDLPDRRAVASRYFTAREQHDIHNHVDGERTRAFFRCWTRKEAFIKALGLGLQYPLDRFDVPVGPLAGEGVVDVHDPSRAGAGAWRVRDLEVPEGYIAAIVHDGRSGGAIETLSWSPT